jgi:quinone-modifying oxidoreductase subunit QmoC
MMVESADAPISGEADPAARESTATAVAEAVRPGRVEPDLAFIDALRDQAGSQFKKCFQCGTCSGTCALSPETDAFPRKEMAWAAWGLRDRLLADPDVWLCNQCNDCSAQCPRGGRPGDVLAAVRQECVGHYAFPRFLARWVSRPKYIPVLVAIPAALLSLALYFQDAIGGLLGIEPAIEERIVYAYTRVLPQWLLNAFFMTLSVLVLASVAVGVRRFWKAMRAADRGGRPVKGLLRSILTAVGAAITHRNLALCSTARPRFASHMLVFFGFLGLLIVSVWVVIAPVNPLVRGSFVYPFNFWSPWKMLANVGGVAVVLGCALMLRDRLVNRDEAGRSRYQDWMLLVTLLAVVLSGFATEFLHYIRLEPHRHVAYFVHLVLIFALLVYMPFSKLAHLVYRTTAMVYAERTGRTVGGAPAERESGVTT